MVTWGQTYRTGWILCSSRCCYPGGRSLTLGSGRAFTKGQQGSRVGELFPCPPFPRTDTLGPSGPYLRVLVLRGSPYSMARWGGQGGKESRVLDPSRPGPGSACLFALGPGSGSWVGDVGWGFFQAGGEGTPHSGRRVRGGSGIRREEARPWGSSPVWRMGLSVRKWMERA